MKFWSIIKVVLLIFASVVSIFDTSYVESESIIGWEPVIIGLLLFPIIVIIGLFVLVVIFRRRLDFEQPNWLSNPLNFSHPEHFFHLAGVIMLTSGVCGMLATYFRLGELGPISFVPITMGIGMMVGIWLLKIVYIMQSKSSNKSNQQGPSAGTR